jgi:pimeloyl-ACP methyl ester carboxylesterase
MMRARLQRALTSRGEEDTVADAVNRYLCEVVEIYLGSSNEALGCAVFCTALSETTNCEAIREMLAKTLQALDGILEAYLARAFMADSQVPWGVDALSGAVSQPAWKTKPSFYLVATEDKMIPPPAQRGMAGRAKAQVTEVPGSHAIYVSKPAEIAELIQRAADARA